MGSTKASGSGMGANQGGGGGAKTVKTLLKSPRKYGARDRKVADAKKAMKKTAAYRAATPGAQEKMLEDEKDRIHALPQYQDPYSNTRTTNTNTDAYRSSGGVADRVDAEDGDDEEKLVDTGVFVRVEVPVEEFEGGPVNYIRKVDV